MKCLKPICTLLLVTCVYFFSGAQMVNPEVMEVVATKMAEQIQLDETKKQLFIDELKNSVVQIEAIQNSSETSLEDKQFEVVKLLKSSDDKIKQLLSPAEYAAFKQLQTEFKSNKLKGSNGDDKTQEVLAQLKSELQLTDDKTQALGEVLIGHENKKREIKAEHEGNLVAIRNQIKTLNQKTNLSVKELLTEAEYKAYIQLIMKVNQDR